MFLYISGRILKFSFILELCFFTTKYALYLLFIFTGSVDLAKKTEPLIQLKKRYGQVDFSCDTQNF